MKDDFKLPVMDVSLSIGCPNNCKYCPQKLIIEKYAEHSNQNMFSLEDWKVCLSKIPKNVRIDFAGFSEPFTNPNCTEIIEYTYSRGYTGTISTTLIGLKREELVRLDKIPFKHFFIHLPDNEGLTSIKVDLDYLEKLEIILKKNLFKNRMFIYFHTIESRIEKLLKKYKVKTFEMKLGSRGGNLEEYRCDKKKKGKCYCNCSKDLKHNILIPNGEVLLCSSDYGMKHILGNLKKQSYESLFYSKIYYVLLESMKNGGIGTLCENCEGCIKVYSIENAKRKTIKLLRGVKKSLML